MTNEKNRIERLFRLKEFMINNSYKPLKISEIASNLGVTTQTVRRDIKLIKTEANLLKLEDLSFSYNNDLTLASRMFMNLMASESININKAKIMQMWLDTRTRYVDFLRNFNLVSGVSSSNITNINLNIPKEVLNIIEQENIKNLITIELPKQEQSLTDVNKEVEQVEIEDEEQEDQVLV